MLVFGPVPSRRLGQSLGINNIPPKTCSYSCVYCQIGRTHRMQISRQAFYDPEVIAEEVSKRVASLRAHGEGIDYLSFVPDGEPTLDTRIAETIELLKNLAIPVAVITNSSLLSVPQVRQAISGAHWVSVKIDAVSPRTWHRINRPYRGLKLAEILDGIMEFSSSFKGCLTTETMLVRGVNESEDEVRSIAEFISQIKPETSYISVPTRPPAEPWVRPPTEATLNMAHHVFTSFSLSSELLMGHETQPFGFTGDVTSDILGATAVHPMRKQSVLQLLAKAGASWSTVEDLLASGKLVEVRYEGECFYIRSLPNMRNLPSQEE